MGVACPWCLEIEPGGATYCCNECEAEPDPSASAVLGYPVMSTPRVRLHHPLITAAPGIDPGDRQTYPVCPQCGNEVSRRVCGKCHRDLPPFSHEATGSTSIVLSGARDAGKTVYIDVVASYLQQLPALLRPLGIQLTVTALDSTTAIADLESRQRMWEGGEAAKRTPRVGDGALPPPRVYGLVRRQGEVTRTHVLILRDVPGEDLDRPETTSIPAFAFMGRADLLLLLVDPFQIRAVRDRLSDAIPIGSQRYSEPVNVLRNVRLLQGNRNAHRTAVVLAKFDALHELAMVPDNSLSLTMTSAGFSYNRDPGILSPLYHHEDSLLLHEEIRSLLEVLGAGGFLAEVEMYLHGSRFFAVSALGHQPRGTALAQSGISAFRVMDPITWALSGSGILDDLTVGLPRTQPAVEEPGPEPGRRWPFRKRR
jgi:hypothetical protein